MNRGCENNFVMAIKDLMLVLVFHFKSIKEKNNLYSIRI